MTTAPNPESPSRRTGLLRTAVALAAVAAVVAIAARGGDGVRDTQAAQPPVQLHLVQAERFAVQQPFAHLWRADAQQVRSGWLLVLDGDIAPVRQNLEPVLYVGNQTAERINAAPDGGKLVVLVPGDFRLEDAPIFYGAPALPEELRQQDIDAARDAAVRGGAVAPTQAAVAAATAAGGEHAPYPTDFELRLRAIDLVERWSPTERDLIAGWRVPRVR